VDGQEAWKFSGKKRKKGKQKEFLKGIKLRKTSSTDSPSEAFAKTVNTDPPEEKPRGTVQQQVAPPQDSPATASTKKESPSAAPRKTSTPIVSLGLGNYSSDEDD
jgi:hypothetical protein